MPSKDEIIQGIRATDARIDAIAAAIEANPDTPLLEGTWAVRDALCHLAARGNGAAMVQQNWLDPNAPPRPANFNIDDINAGQIRDRAGDDVPALLAEIKAGHAASIETLQSMDDATLARELKVPFRDEPMTAGELIHLAGSGHDGSHVKQIEDALR